MSGETVFSRAADIIRERGHAKGVYAHRNGAVCVHGALHVANGRPASVCVNNLVAECQYDDLVPLLSRRGVTVAPAAWQDMPHTSTEDVLLLLKEAHVEAGGS